jgi:hypothetical protein
MNKSKFLILILTCLLISSIICLKRDSVENKKNITPPKKEQEGQFNKNIVSLSMTKAGSHANQGDATTLANTAATATGIRMNVKDSPNANVAVQNSQVGNYVTFKGWAAKKFFRQSDSREPQRTEGIRR